MRVPRSDHTGEAGVDVVGWLFRTQLEWLFRPQLHSDKGIDAHVEPVTDEKASGRLLGLQIKSGQSYLNERSPTGFVYRPDQKHVEYWLHHALPVLIVLVDVEAGRAWWEVVNDDTLIRAKRGWKMVVPDRNELTASTASELLALADGDPYVLRLRQLQLARAWMEVLRDGGRVIVDLEEWVNKTSGRAAVQLTAIDVDGTQVGSFEWPWIMLPYAEYEFELPKLFPWANVDVEPDTYDEADHDRYESECAHHDEDETFYSETFTEWQDGRLVRGLRPYADNGEVADWRLELTLNELGSAFLRLDDYIASADLAPLVAN